MTKRILLLACPIAASLALAGCSAGSSDQAPATSGSPSAVTSQEGTGGQTTGKNLSAQQVEDIASKLLDGDPSVQVIGNEQMQPQLSAAKNATQPDGIKPEKCAELNAEYTVTDLTGSVAATSTSSSEQLGKVVQVFSLTNEATRKNVQDALALDDLAGCETVTIEQGGKEIKAQRQVLPLDVKAERSLTMSTIMDAGGGQKLSSVAVQALDGNNFVLVTLQTGSMQPAELATQAVELTDQAFDEIKATQ
ncbi:hypothetical protein OF385_04755 [Glutamicibacter sp. JL.03c]|uniref:hypothetical protein n=1 Tax=Glutamicibacter sp. JL.03c TaxID=2984842 RepID=UPI0021F79184|nr:hypothetical protein [Glutamicibacter sp. JL.03c]UYQ78465.1 hypothetical protein OF385_04755 [Glutamicibacter sp. JL.03c]